MKYNGLPSFRHRMPCAFDPLVLGICKASRLSCKAPKRPMGCESQRDREKVHSARGSAAVHGVLVVSDHFCKASEIQAPAPVYESKSGSIVRSPRASPRGAFLVKKSSHFKHLVKYSISEVFGSILHSAIFCILCLVIWFQFSKVEMLEDLQDKANSELNELRAKEVPKQTRHVHCQTPTEAVVFIVVLIFIVPSAMVQRSVSFSGELVCKTVSGLGLTVFPLLCPVAVLLGICSERSLPVMLLRCCSSPFKIRLSSRRTRRIT